VQLATFEGSFVVSRLHSGSYSNALVAAEEISLF
jgi:hypothetical protein